MRHIGIFLLGLLLSFNAFATNPSTGNSVHIAAATTNIGTSFSTAYPQLAITAPRPNYRHAYIYNGCSGVLAVTFTNGTTAVAPSSPTQLFFIPPMGAGSPGIQLAIGPMTNVWVRSDSGAACSAGDVAISLY